MIDPGGWVRLDPGGGWGSGDPPRLRSSVGLAGKHTFTPIDSFQVSPYLIDRQFLERVIFWTRYTKVQKGTLESIRA